MSTKKKKLQPPLVYDYIEFPLETGENEIIIKLGQIDKFNSKSKKVLKFHKDINRLI